MKIKLVYLVFLTTVMSVKLRAMDRATVAFKSLHFTNHANERQIERNISKCQIMNAIRNGIETLCGKGRVKYEDSSTTIVIDPSNLHVITLFSTSKTLPKSTAARIESIKHDAIFFKGGRKQSESIILGKSAQIMRMRHRKVKKASIRKRV